MVDGLKEVIADALAFSRLSREDQWRWFHDHELEQGFKVIGVGKAVWFNPDDWTDDTLITQDSRRIRLVLINAKHPGQGAFTRLIKAIQEHGLIPTIVEPNQLLIDWCNRHDFRSKKIGKGRYAHIVYYPRRCAY